MQPPDVVAAGRCRSVTVVPMTDLGHETDAMQRRVEIDHLALVHIETECLDPCVSAGHCMTMCEERHTNQANEEQRIPEAQAIDIDDAAEIRAINDDVLRRDVVQKRRGWHAGKIFGVSVCGGFGFGR